MKNLTIAYDSIKKYKKDVNAQDSDRCTYVDEALNEYKQSIRQNTERTSTYSSAYTRTPNRTNNSRYESSNTQDQTKSNYKDINELRFNGGVLKRKIGKDGKQVVVNKISGYEFTDKNGKTHTLYIGNTFDYLAKPEFRKIIEQKILSVENLKRVDSYDVQDPNAQYGYAGGLLYGDYTCYKNIREDFRRIELKKTQELKFNGGVLKRKIGEDGKQVVANEINGYEFTDENGKTHTLYIGNTFDYLAKPEFRKIIEQKILSVENLKRVDSYDVQDPNAQYGYAGGLLYGDYTCYKNIREDFRRIELKKTQELKFNGGVLKRKIGKDGKQVVVNKISGYEFTDKNGKTHTLYIDNTFEELATPSYKQNIERKILSDENLERVDSHDLRNPRAQYGYAGGLLYGDYTCYKNTREDFKRMEQKRLKVRIAETKDGEQKVITLENGQKLYGYNIFSIQEYLDTRTTGTDVYFENPVDELVSIVKTCQSHGSDFQEIFSNARNSKFRYAGKLTKIGNVITDPKIQEELGRRIKQIEKKREFEGYMSREAKLQHSLDALVNGDRENG